MEANFNLELLSDDDLGADELGADELFELTAAAALAWEDLQEVRTEPMVSNEVVEVGQPEQEERDFDEMVGVEDVSVADGQPERAEGSFDEVMDVDEGHPEPEDQGSDEMVSAADDQPERAEGGFDEMVHVYDGQQPEPEDEGGDEMVDADDDAGTLLAYIKERKSKNTVRKVEGNYARFIKWLCDKKNERADPITLPPETLDCYIGHFILQLKKENGEEYKPDTVTAYYRSVASKLLELGYVNIIHDDRFATSRKVLESKRKELKQSGRGNKPNKADPLTTEQEETLWEKGQLGYNNPRALLNTIWYQNTKLLGFRGSHESRQLKWGDIKLKVDENNSEYLEFNERLTKTRQGNSTHHRVFQPKMFPNASDPSRCPVKAYKMYMERRPAGMMCDDSPFYLAVNDKYELRNNWYKCSPLGQDSLGNMMTRMARESGLKGHITNHSVRKTVCTTLLQAGVPPNTIIQLTGHKNIQSLQNYAVASTEQQKAMCSILQGHDNDNSRSAFAVPQAPYIRPQILAPSNSQPSPPSNPLSVHRSSTSVSVSAHPSSTLNLFAGSHFHAPVCVYMAPPDNKH